MAYGGEKFTHWVCKECEIENCNSYRTICLGCNKKRNEIELTDTEEIRKYRNKWYGPHPLKNKRGRFSSDVKTNFKGEYI